MSIIPVIYAIFIATLLFFIVSVKGFWLLKAIVTPLVIFAAFIIGNSIEESIGWPIERKLPEKFELFSVLINEPDDIFVWIKSYSYEGKMTFDIFDMEKPRAYRIPYTKKLHKQLYEMNRDIGKSGKSKRLGKKQSGDADSMYQYGENEDLDLYELPPPSYPDKEAE